MDKYHIYEEIGKGEFSQVFKGREKKKIEYVAIKRTDKSVMNKIVSEVQVMHKLSHPHMLKFYDWYETRNNLWIILEYCTGGDLESILKQDGHLPETSVRIFGIDMVAGLKYLHSNGIIHGDLRPRNFLIDEYGILKLSDFKFAQKIPKDALGDAALVNRGSAAYMSPELFTPEGVHSFQSDFWALGCVLYELRRGFLPFGDLSTSSLDSLVESIRTMDPVAQPKKSSGPPPTLSPDIADCLLWLLEKAPMNRCTWAALCAHPFWSPSNIAPPTALPPQPAFDELVRTLEHARSEQLQQATNAEFMVDHPPFRRADLSIEANRGTAGPPVRSSPLKLPGFGSTPMRTAAVAAADTASPARTGGLGTVDEQATPIVNVRNPSTKHGLQQQRDEEEHSPRARVPTPHAAPHTAAVAAAVSGRGPSRNSPVRQPEERGGREHPSGYSSPIIASALLIHPSEMQVKPIVGSKQIEVIDGYEVSSALLPFEVADAEELGAQAAGVIEAHLTVVYKALHKTAIAGQATVVTAAVTQALADRVNILKYLCTICASAEVSNLILNTHFLTLVLKLLRHTVAYTAGNATPVRGASGPQAAVAMAQGQLATARFWCATLLALLLRFATFIQPPPAKNRDDHILSTLVHLLNEGSPRSGGAVDAKLKKRLVAAFGEIIFYITAQEEDEETAEAERWTLPQVAIEILGRCLRDDNDEVVKHYAAKTIENVLAQGGVSYRYRFISMDIASKLLELAQNSLHEALQMTCATALSHTVSLAMTTHCLGPEVALAVRRVASTAALAKSASSVSSSAKKAPQTQLVDPFAAPTVVNGAKFVAKLFEKANLPGIVELLRDGQQPKVQQCFLNIINAVFTAPLLSAEGLRAADAPAQAQGSTWEADAATLIAVAVDPAHETFVKTLFTPLRGFFVRAHTSLVPVLFRMLEQGSMTIVRSKALLLCHHLCTHLPAILVIFAEKRLPSLLIRLLEPALSASEASRQAGSAAPQPTYLVKCALVAVAHWKDLAQAYMQELASHLEEISKLSPEVLAMDASGLAGGTPQGKKTVTRSPGLLSPQQQRSPTGARMGSEVSGKPIEKLSFSSTQLRHTSDLLRSVISLAASQPAMTRLVLGGNAAFVAELSKAIRALPLARSTVLSIATRLLPNDMTESILIAEQACLASLETIAQIDIPDHAAVATGGPLVGRDGWSGLGVGSGAGRSAGRGADNAWPWQQDWTAFVALGLHELLPALAQLLAHPDGDIRAVVTACLRRLLPTCVRAYVAAPSGSAVQLDRVPLAATACQAVLPFVPLLLGDQAPIPQYVTRLLVDTLAVSKDVAALVVPALQTAAVLPALVDRLRLAGGEPRDRAASDDQDAPAPTLDPQLVVLVHGVFDQPQGAAWLLQCDLAGALSVAFIGAVYGGVSVPFPRTTQTNFDLLVSLAELLFHVLHFVLREVSVGGGGGGGGGQGESLRRLAMPLRAASPALLLLAAFCEQQAAQGAELKGADPLVLAHLLDLSSRAVGVLFDLFPDALTSQLLSRQSVALDGSSSAEAASALTPRAIVAQVLRSRHAEAKVKAKLLKIVLGLVKVSASLGIGGKAKELVLADPLHSAVAVCARARDREDPVARVAMQLLEAAGALR